MAQPVLKAHLHVTAVRGAVSSKKQSAAPGLVLPKPYMHIVPSGQLGNY